MQTGAKSGPENTNSLLAPHQRAGFFLDLIAMLIRRQSNNLLDLEVPVSPLYLLAAPLEGLLKRIS